MFSCRPTQRRSSPTLLLWQAPLADRGGGVGVFESPLFSPPLQVRDGAISLARPEGSPPLVGWGVEVRPKWVAAATRRAYDPQEASKTGGGL
jgi:hypothetical protein